METIRTIQQVNRKPRPLTRCRAGSAQPVKKRTTRINRNGFLTHTFQPFWAYEGNKARAEKEFFRSLENICTYYDLLIPDVTGLTFPQNIYRSWEITAERIKAIDKHLDCIILQDDTFTATLATVRQFDTGMTLYYIPVKPLWNWVQQAKQQALSEIVIAIFAYLYQVVQVPFYTEQSSYLHHQYHYLDEMINEDMENDEEEDAYRREQLDELYTLQNAGIHLLRQISDPQQLTNMDTLVLNYSKAEKCDNDWAILAIEFVQLYNNYPDRSFFDHIRPDFCHPEIEERIHADQYMSFYWSGNDCLQESLFCMIDSEFQEAGITDEPTAVEVFDTLTEKKNENFGFETRLLALINRLCQLLTHHDND
ncbi:hypothetical protein SAMN05216464_105312 [Mucilaginibacter pineti]|uniref:Uncharacterized protein n=1 Tax=Mucilaginibacter pineti TaxID=1391627 RepID=A0A1G7C6S9_9SPHI|nr:hypothetical protein SAMN05216464_105312 [Mucilaginibacter pineti]